MYYMLGLFLSQYYYTQIPITFQQFFRIILTGAKKFLYYVSPCKITDYDIPAFLLLDFSRLSDYEIICNVRTGILRKDSHPMPPDSPDLSPDLPAPDRQALRLPSLPQRLEIVERITSAAIDLPEVAPYRNRAQFTFFAGDAPAQWSGYEGQLEVVGRCLEWFVFDYIIPELDATPAQYWLAFNLHLLSPRQRADAQDCLEFILSLFEVTQIEPGLGFVALDLLRPSQSYSIREHLISNEMQTGQLLLARLFPHRGSLALSGMAAVMGPHALAQIKQFIHQGKLKPAALIKELDGLELENLFGRSLHDLTQNLSLDEIYRRLRRYLTTLPSPPFSLEQLQEMLADSGDPLRLAADLCRQIPVFCRHEMDLLYALISVAWHQCHHS